MNHNSQDIALLSAYMDGELNGDDTHHVERRLMDDAAFAKLFTQLQKDQQYIQQTLGAIEQTPIPQHLIDALSKPVEAEKQVTLFDYLQRAFQLHAMAAAAALVLAITVGVVMLRTGDASLDRIVAELESSPAVVQGLSTMVAGESIDTEFGIMTEVLAFRNKNRQVCKQVMLQHDQFVDVVFCHRGKSWLYSVASARDSVSEGFVPADGSGPTKIDTFIEKNIDGSVLSVRQERDALSELWQ
ncbi:hypothetical protein P886_2461 [Alteromonadaceae bacterium 2753L.S.0a.02]|nr:hypothetical protein P886_2461 [Alteromonadaceae bacterium 2753L.S.0a.02]